ncbi:MAG: hypothetical protein U9N42_10645, partial [Campylobacterota bacterium]|nr:hypothetical protein [Campylobacterota bacterium]
MIGLELPNQKASNGLAKLALGENGTTSSKSDGKFSMLLSSFNLSKMGDEVKQSTLLGVNTKPLQNSEDGESKGFFENKSILSLLGEIEESSEGDTQKILTDFKGVNLTKLPSTSEIKELIFKAKAYLKEQITQLSSEHEVKNLPKTLGGLIQLAEKKGVDVKSITLDTIKESPLNAKETPKSKNTLDLLTPKSKVVIDSNEQKNESTTEQKTTPKSEALKNILELKETIKNAPVEKGVKEAPLHVKSENVKEMPTQSKEAPLHVKSENLKEMPTQSKEAPLHVKSENIKEMPTQSKEAPL